MGKKSIVFIFILVFAFLSVNFVSADSDSDNISKDEKIKVEMILEETTFSRTDKEEIVFKISNINSEDIKLIFTSSKKFDFYLFNLDYELSEIIKNYKYSAVYQWSADKMFRQAFQEIKLPSGDSLSFNVNLNFTDIPEGEYLLMGELLSQNYIIQSSIIKVTVK
ncbi:MULTISPECIES: BsuPI-related putative proteinase inhibitor [unclassified Halanaerobium]|uniref:BsuPI-related putative proteinase inhibitor n=1 Tax=unclassified Halanaerobium TaxID=2641197 RepID=UPI000DF2F231|nr:MULTISPECIES: BsuPI-related putative proteinase inhibitor [unclassified Halanaerobium]RCW49788.1 intracellular proteinase inhibitor BsuPI [Halanaerobium sp. MA284_MarDTE_T2]RCW88466.1 intracellular proteinase inhibitor BsuPI [Halanaerobium sp. DL-01]